jgi:hypothetical protein
MDYGMLKHRFTRSQLVPCPENILNYEKTILTAGVKEINVCEAAGYGIAGSQDYTRCICKAGCKINRCALKKVMFYAIQSVIVQQIAKINNYV